MNLIDGEDIARQVLSISRRDASRSLIEEAKDLDFLSEGLKLAFTAESLEELSSCLSTLIQGYIEIRKIKQLGIMEEYNKTQAYLENAVMQLDHPNTYKSKMH